MKVKSMLMLAMTGIVGLGAPLAAWASGTDAVPLQDLVLVEESGGVVSSNEGGGGRYDRPRYDRPRYDRPRYDRPRYDRPRYDRPRYDRPRYDRPRYDRPRWDNSTAPGAGVELPAPRVSMGG